MVLTFEQTKEKAEYEHKHKKELIELKADYSEKSHKRKMAELNLRLEIAKTELKKQLENDA